MSKKKSKAEPLSKKARKALEAREAALAAELAARAKAKGKKKAKPEKPKSGKKKTGKKAKAPKVDPLAADGSMTFTATAEAPIVPIPEAEPEAQRETPAEVAERAKPLDGDALKAAMDADTDAAIRARVQAKREARARLDAVPAKIAEGKKARAAKAGSGDLGDPGDYIEPPEPAEQIAEVVETETGTIIEVGPAAGDEFGKPSEAPRSFEENTNGLGQYKIKTLDDPRVERGYTRVTTYIDCLEDKKMLTDWKMRVLLEGVAAMEEDADTVTAKVRDLVHNRDVEIAKARKADRKGKLEPGELGRITEGAWSTFKKALDKLADEVFEVGGGREKAQKGTDIHALCDLAEREGVAAVEVLLAEEQITPADLADVRAYLDAIARLGVKPVAAELVVVDDETKTAGRLDRIYYVKLPGELRARKRVVDLKTGRVDYGRGKIAQQIHKYATSKAYDEVTGERTPLGVDTKVGLLIHLPAGTAKATVHVVDLTIGAKGNRLAAEVRAFRNEGKRAIDTKTNVLDAVEG